jgi:hypothetical protein
MELTLNFSLVREGLLKTLLFLRKGFGMSSRRLNEFIQKPATKSNIKTTL